MRFSKLFWCLFGMAICCACSDNEVPNVIDSESGQEGHFLAVEIVNPAAAMTRSGEPGSGDFEAGESTPDENKITSLRFYFFDAVGGPVTLKNSSYNYLDPTPIPAEDGNDMPNVEQKLKAVIVVNPTNSANVGSMIAVANFDKAIATQSPGLMNNKSYSREELASVVGNYSTVGTEEAPCFMMTSSTYADANGQVTRAFINPAKHLCDTQEKALANPIPIYIERVVAKVRLNTEWRTTAEPGKVTMEKRDNVQYGEGTYTAIKAKDKDGNVIQNGGKDVYILFTGWDVTGKADKSYFIKKVNSTTNWTELSGKWFWNHPEYHRSYWAVNPNGVKLQYDNHTSIRKDINGGFTYCQENAADFSNYATGQKTVYDPAATTSNRTQAILAAVLVTIDDANKATPISLAKWGYADYTEADVKTAMLGIVGNQIYYETTPAGETSKRTFSSISTSPTYVKLVTAKDAGMANNDTEISARYLSYPKLADADTEPAKEVQFYSSDVTSAINDADGTVDEIKVNAAKITHEKVNEILRGVPGAKIWHDGLTYYYTDIRHLHQNANNAGWGYYGVVRNHIYDIKINSVTGLGTPVLDPNEVIIPQKPAEDKDIYVAAQINILSWRIVNNNVDLDW